MTRTGILPVAALVLSFQPSLAAEAPVAFALERCGYVEAIVRLPSERVAPSIPADFSLMVQGGLATLNVGGAVCAAATSDVGDGTASFAWVLARVAPPDDLSLRGVRPQVWFYRLEHLVTPGDVYDAVSLASGAERRHAGPIIVELGPVLSSLTVGAEEMLEVDIPASPPDGGVGGAPIRWREYHEVDGGYAYLEATLQPDADASSTASVVRAHGIGDIASLVGGVSGGQGLYGADYALSDGEMGLIERS